MGFFNRLKNIVSAKANKALEKHEDPIELLELSINKKEKLLIDAKKQCANFIATVDNIRKEKNELEEKAKKYEEATKAAILKDDSDKAQSFVKQKIDIEEKVNQTNIRIKEQDEKIKLIKNKIQELEIEISKMKSKKQELATRLDVAEINNEINETLAGLNDNYGINLNELEKKVAQKESYGNALEDLKAKNEDELLDEYINSSPAVDNKVNDELERIKREMEYGKQNILILYNFCDLIRVFNIACEGCVDFDKINSKAVNKIYKIMYLSKFVDENLNCSVICIDKNGIPRDLKSLMELELIPLFNICHDNVSKK